MGEWQEDMFDRTPTYTVTQAQYDFLRDRIAVLEADVERFRELHRGALDLNTDLVIGARRMQAEAWDEGYEVAITDTEARSAPPGPNGPVDPTRNPYRTEEA